MSGEPRICARCPTRLSRYNRDDLCASCWEKQREARGVRSVQDSTLVKRRICSTRGCGRVLSQGTAGDRCRACYESQSVAGQQRALAEKNPHAVLLGSAGGKRGGPARTAAMTPEQRRERGRQAANARWQRSKPEEDQPVMVAQRDREKVTMVERERVTITAAEGSIKTVALKSGGQITVNIVADFFRLTAGDRELVLGLVDALNAFEQGQPPPSFHHCACEHYKAAGEVVADISKDGNCLVCGAWMDDATHKPGCAQAVLEAAGVGS